MVFEFKKIKFNSLKYRIINLSTGCLNSNDQFKFLKNEFKFIWVVFWIQKGENKNVDKFFGWNTEYEFKMKKNEFKFTIWFRTFWMMMVW